MATFHVKTGTTKAAKGAGKQHALYISGEGRYGHKSEVCFVQDGNIPPWAKDGLDFFAQADNLERANGRSGRKLIIAIPHEATDKKKWAVELIQSIVKEQPYRLAIHSPVDGNTHVHVLFGERTNNFEMLKADYFTRQNPKLLTETNIKTNGKKNPDKTKKVQFFAQKSWLKDVRLLTLEKIREVVPDFEIGQGREVQIGPDRPHATEEQKKARDKRIGEVQASRAMQTEIKQLEAQLTKDKNDRRYERSSEPLAKPAYKKLEKYGAGAKTSTRQKRCSGQSSASLFSVRSRKMVSIHSRGRVLLSSNGSNNISRRRDIELRRVHPAGVISSIRDDSDSSRHAPVKGLSSVPSSLASRRSLSPLSSMGSRSLRPRGFERQ